jgi:hypothetical protein
LRFALDEPAADLELRGVLRAASSAALADLGDIGSRARRLATLHSSWRGWVAVAITERRRNRWLAARAALELALQIAPGATVAHLEMAITLLELGDVAPCRTHAAAVFALEGPTPSALAVRACALAAEGRVEAAAETARRAVAMQPNDEVLRTILTRLQRQPKQAWSQTLAKRISSWWE